MAWTSLWAWERSPYAAYLGHAGGAGPLPLEAILFSLGAFACCRLLPRATFWVGVHYLATGTLCLMLGAGAVDQTHWMMLGTFGVGQLLAAAILYFTLERNHGGAHS